MKKIAFAVLLLANGTPPALCAGYGFLNAGIDYLNQARYSDAITWLDKALAAGDLTPDQTRVAYIDRAIAHGETGDINAMIADYSAVLATKPDDPFIARQRGLAYAAMGKDEEAVADFAVARRKYPKDKEIAGQEAFASWRIGRYEQSAGAFAQLTNYGVTYWLFLQLANRRAGKPALSLDKQSADTVQWPGPLRALYTGKIDEKEILQLWPQLKGEQICDANFYVGEWQMANGDHGGIDLVRKASEVCSQGSVEKNMATFEVEKQAGKRK